jgi:hypothetical protein
MPAQIVIQHPMADARRTGVVPPSVTSAWLVALVATKYAEIAGYDRRQWGEADNTL